jgi:hypothetical protein
VSDAEAAHPGGFLLGGAVLRVLDSITEAVGGPPGQVVVSGSHGGVSAGRFAIEARVRLAVFNDAGVGLDGAGIAALPLLQAHGIAALTVAHDTAHIGEAASTLATGVISHTNAAAAALGARPGLALSAWLEAARGGAPGAAPRAAAPPTPAAGGAPDAGSGTTR